MIESMVESNFAFGPVMTVIMLLINSGNLLALPVVNTLLVVTAEVAINTKWSVPWKFPLMAFLIYSGGIVLQNVLLTYYVPGTKTYFPPGRYSFLLVLLYAVPYILHFGSGIMVLGVAVSELCEEAEVTNVIIYVKQLIFMVN